jgi:hypothetical protein
LIGVQWFWSKFFSQKSFPQTDSHQKSLQVDFARFDDLYTQATGIVALAISVVDSW